MTRPCHAIQQSDEMVCHKCRLRWDVNDAEPPRCKLTVATRDLGERLENSTGFVSALAPSRYR